MYSTTPALSTSELNCRNFFVGKPPLALFLSIVTPRKAPKIEVPHPANVPVAEDGLAHVDAVGAEEILDQVFFFEVEVVLPLRPPELDRVSCTQQQSVRWRGRGGYRRRRPPIPPPSPNITSKRSSNIFLLSVGRHHRALALLQGRAEVPSPLVSFVRKEQQLSKEKAPSLPPFRPPHELLVSRPFKVEENEHLCGQFDYFRHFALE